MKVLLVDDYRTTTDLLADVACSMGHAVTRAYSGAEALAAAGGNTEAEPADETLDRELDDELRRLDDK